MLVPIALLDNTVPDVRTVPPPASSDAALLRSIKTAGILQPILVRPEGNRYGIVAGRRRVRLGATAGLTEIEASVREMTDQEAIEAQVAENLQRENMHPIDQWRAARAMLGAGSTVAEAATALGFGERETRCMEKLAALHPKLLDLAVKKMPSVRDLRIIAAAPKTMQTAALKARDAIGRDGAPDWYRIANACWRVAIPKGYALFDKATNVHWQEDWFAEPGAADQFTTTDAEAFLAAQRTVLMADIEKRKRAGERVALASCSVSDGVVLPKGHTRCFARSDDEVFTGETGPTRFYAISESRSNYGQVISVVAEAPLAAQRKAAALARDADPGPAGDTEPPEAATPDPAGITKRGQTILAATKTLAIGQHLLGIGPSLSIELLAACLVVALASDNVRISPKESRYAGVDFADLTERLIDPAGRLVLDDAAIGGIVAEALARILIITDPATGYGSGPPAEWIGHALSASAALPRFDTAAFLATLSKRDLMSVAHDALGASMPATTAALREALTGKLPDWRPTTFGAPGPKPKRKAPVLRVEEDMPA